MGDHSEELLLQQEFEEQLMIGMDTIPPAFAAVSLETEIRLSSFGYNEVLIGTVSKLPLGFRQEMISILTQNPLERFSVLALINLSNNYLPVSEIPRLLKAAAISEILKASLTLASRGIHPSMKPDEVYHNLAVTMRKIEPLLLEEARSMVDEEDVDYASDQVKHAIDRGIETLAALIYTSEESFMTEPTKEHIEDVLYQFVRTYSILPASLLFGSDQLESSFTLKAWQIVSDGLLRFNMCRINFEALRSLFGGNFKSDISLNSFDHGLMTNPIANLYQKAATLGDNFNGQQIIKRAYINHFLDARDSKYLELAILDEALIRPLFQLKPDMLAILDEVPEGMNYSLLQILGIQTRLAFELLMWRNKN